MPCGLTDPVGCVTDTVLGGLAGDAVGKMASSAWESICKSFADAMVELLKTFSGAFVKMPGPDLASNGVRSVYAISLGIAALVACLLVIGQVVRTAVTHDGRPLATAAVGLGKAVLAFMLTLIVASTTLVASDELTKYIVDSSLGGQQAFSDKIAKLVAWNPGNSVSLLLILAIIGILLTLVLWFEMLLRGAAIAVLIATSPISAAGQVSDSTKTWWSKLVSMTIQLIILKPIIALVFALGFNLAGDSQDLNSTLSGMLVLLLAALAWPAVARFFTFASVQVGGGAGLAALLGFAGGRLSTAGGPPTGASPDTFGQDSASRTMSSFASKGGSAAGGAAGGAGGAGAAAGGAGAAAGPIGMAAAAGVRLAQQAVNSLAGGMEKMAGHAGAQGANPYAAQPAGYVNRHAGAPLPTSGYLPDQPKPDWSGQEQEQQPEPAEPAAQQADHQQALQDATPDLPVASAPRSDPPTIEMPPVPAGPPASSAAAGAAPLPGPAPQGGSGPVSPLRAPQPGNPEPTATAPGAATAPPAEPKAPAAASPTAAAAAPLNTGQPAPAVRPAATPKQADRPPNQPLATDPGVVRPEVAPSERPAEPPRAAPPATPTHAEQPEGGDQP
ncbi:hypothetical protein GCM10009759_76160 [Kitasatospora saccharophila]|uniref:TrbL/VirB6 plasmid conjugal transfer protein n=1 Tax=Kitasatospora saccharophila TaxID=407973 RepID=A0ABN2YAF0_9ACTN